MGNPFDKDVFTPAQLMIRSVCGQVAAMSKLICEMHINYLRTKRSRPLNKVYKWSWSAWERYFKYCISDIYDWEVITLKITLNCISEATNYNEETLFLLPTKNVSFSKWLFSQVLFFCYESALFHGLITNFVTECCLFARKWLSLSCLIQV